MSQSAARKVKFVKIKHQEQKDAQHAQSNGYNRVRAANVM